MTNEVDSTTNKTPRVQRCSDLLGALEIQANEAHNAQLNNAVRGPQIHLSKNLSEMHGGYLKPGVGVLHGVPNSGKTAFLARLTATCGCPALYITTEIPPLELFMRQIACVTNRPLKVLLSGDLTGIEMRALGHATAAAMPELCFLDATAIPVSVAAIQREVRDLRNEVGHELVVLDSIHSWARRNVEGSNEYERMTAAMGAFEQLAAVEQIPLIVVAERSRGTMQTGGMHAAKGTASIEYSARSVWGLNVVNDGKREGDSIGVTLHIEKNKDGASGSQVGFRFFPDHMRFIEEA